MIKYLIILISFLFITGCSLDVTDKPQELVSDNITQFSTKTNLLNKEYFKKFNLYDVEKNGNFGLGTLNGVDGEVIILDGIFYQVDYTGKVNLPEKWSLTPFANIKFFNSDKSVTIKDKNQTGTFDIIKFNNPEDKLSAVKIAGVFKSVKARSVKKVKTQTKTLEQIINDQAVFDFDNVKGTMVGYYIPDKYNTECFTGFHFHFISENKKLGGHILDFKIDSVNVYIDFSDSLKLVK